MGLPTLQRIPVLAVIQCAMDIEAAPFLERLTNASTPLVIGGGPVSDASGNSARSSSGPDSAEASEVEVIQKLPQSKQFVGKAGLLAPETPAGAQKGDSPVKAVQSAKDTVLSQTDSLNEQKTENGRQTFTLGTWNGHPVLIVTSGIGLANSASATARALMLVRPQVVIAAGTAGGLAASVNVGDVVIATSAVFNAADATAFGYARGQIPGMPPIYEVSSMVLATARRLLIAQQARPGLGGSAGRNSSAGDSDRSVERYLTDVDGSHVENGPANEGVSSSGWAGENSRMNAGGSASDINTAVKAGLAGVNEYPILVGQAISGDAFVTATNVGSMREDFPEALTTDMETAALAQVAWSSGTDWVMIRAVSDLCGPAADQDFHMDAAQAAMHSCDVVEAFLRLVL